MPVVQPRDQGHLLSALRQRNSTHTEAGLVADVIEYRIELQFVQASGAPRARPAHRGSWRTCGRSP